GPGGHVDLLRRDRDRAGRILAPGQEYDQERGGGCGVTRAGSEHHDRSGRARVARQGANAPWTSSSRRDRRRPSIHVPVGRTGDPDARAAPGGRVGSGPAFSDLRWGGGRNPPGMTAPRLEERASRRGDRGRPGRPVRAPNGEALPYPAGGGCGSASFDLRGELVEP